MHRILIIACATACALPAAASAVQPVVSRHADLKRACVQYEQDRQLVRVQTPDSPGRDVCEQGASPGKHATLSAVDRSDRVLEQAIVVYLPPPAPPAPPVTPAATAAPTVDAPSAQPSATASASTSVSAPASLQAIAQCESSGNAGARNGQYGGLYQFDQQTWQSVGGTGDPAQASPQEQTMRAEMLMSQRGSNPWPVCGAGK